MARALAARTQHERKQIGHRPLFVIPQSELTQYHLVVEEFDLEFGDGIDRFLIVHIPQSI